MISSDFLATLVLQTQYGSKKCLFCCRIEGELLGDVIVLIYVDLGEDFLFCDGPYSLIIHTSKCLLHPLLGQFSHAFDLFFRDTWWKVISPIPFSHFVKGSHLPWRCEVSSGTSFAPWGEEPTAKEPFMQTNIKPIISVQTKKVLRKKKNNNIGNYPVALSYVLTTYYCKVSSRRG